MECFLAVKDNSSSAVYNPTEAFFLGGMLMCGDEHSRYDFVSLARHNHGYANPHLLAEHRKLVRILAKSVGGEATDLRNRRGRASGSAYFLIPLRCIGSSTRPSTRSITRQNQTKEFEI